MCTEILLAISSIAYEILNSFNLTFHEFKLKSSSALNTKYYSNNNK